jgi:hypothetical protein
MAIKLYARLDDSPGITAVDGIERRVVTSLKELSDFVRDRTAALTNDQHELLGMFAVVRVVVEAGARSPQEAKTLGKVLDSWHFSCRDPHAAQALTRGEGEALFMLGRASDVEAGLRQVMEKISGEPA